MSATNKRVPLAEARALAEEFVTLIKSVVPRVEIAGSIRREKADIGDLEIVAQATLQANDPLDTRLAVLEQSGVFTPELRADGVARSWGSRYRAGYYKGMRLDLFIVRPDRDWGLTFLIRTGPGDANQYLVTRRITMNQHGALPPHLLVSDGALWRLPSQIDLPIKAPPPGSMRIPTPEESDVYAAIGLPFLAPNERTADAYHALRDTALPPLRIPSQPTQIATGRINCGDGDALEITIGGIEDHRVSLLGAALAPTRALVDSYKVGGIDAEQYELRYMALLRWRYRAYPQAFLDILSRPRTVLTCYCSKDGFCHRHLAKSVLAKIAQSHNIPFVLEDEVAALDLNDMVVEQPRLF